MNLALVIARGGSKRIPLKNIKNFMGKPMIYWPIKNALESNLFNQVVVSTEDPEIASISRSFGAETPFIRPLYLADDHSSTISVVKHAIEYFSKSANIHFENICCLYPCSPFVDVEDLAYSLEILKISPLNSFVYPVTDYPHPIQRALRISSKGMLEFISPEHELSRTQDLEKTYHDCGQFYWGRADTWVHRENLHSDSVGYVVPSWRFIDIDTTSDWKRAEILFNAMKKGA